ncbi:myotubularin-related protein 14 [Biomphalaria pfeifferi]|uniref:Myotubularin-related protein 14 n=1 Tax=Biomphalaria pfeifferi TaxID=112525 RepID=A0AAD8BYK3_BIOPF|nr:myotubularin-related protein 14 [Biomphalaria pfeifferi]
MDGDNVDTVVEEEDISKLLNHFMKTSHRVKTADIKGETIMERCILLFSKDYKFTIVPNLNGGLCGHYPMKLIIVEFERDAQSSSENVESRYDAQSIMQRMKNARCARCRSRIVVPVIFYQGKHICRSATLSGAAEMIGRSTTDYFLSSQNSGPQDLSTTDMFDKIRGQDILLLKHFDVAYICDLMVEKKKIKFGMAVSSSEKVDKENRYSDFSILGMPYPGCEFFKNWKDNSYMGENILYDWGQSLNDSSLELPSSPLVEDLNIDWSKYTEWSLVELTQNYLKLLLQYIKKGTHGLLVHCISGWDRTPLFISLLRLSLWADGAIHKSLSPVQILYLTLGYDWYLFGHDLPDRLNNEQEVLYFCFKVLKDIASEEFSVAPRPLPPQALASSPRDTATAPVSHNQQHRFRVDSDSSFHGVLLDDPYLVPSKGSITSLSSLSSNEALDHIHFTLGLTDEDVNGVSLTEDEWEWNRTSTLTNASQRRSKSPIGVTSSAALNLSSSPVHNLSSSPVHKLSSSPVHNLSSSPVNVGQRRLSTDSQQQLSIKSNYFVGSPLLRASSPMSVPQRQETMSSSNSIGSWQIISSSDNLKNMLQGSKNSTSISSTDRSSHVSSCNEAVNINVSTMRWKRLDAVSQLFNTAYSSTVHSQMVKHSSGNGLSSFLDRLAEQVGLKGPKPNSSDSSTRTGV